MLCTQAVILADEPWDEAGGFFALYTRGRGKVRAGAQGVRKENAKLKGHLEPLQLSAVCLVPAKNGYRIIHARLIDPWRGIRDDFLRLASAWRMAHAIERSCFEEEEDERLWDFVVRGFAFLDQAPQRINQNGFFHAFSDRFESRLLEYIQHGSDPAFLNL